MRIDPNENRGSDSERIQAAVEVAARNGGKLVIPARKPDGGAARTYWLLDRAILLPGDFTLVIDNCTLKLSDCCRDNVIRSANCGVGISEVELLKNIHIIGVGNAVLEGADHPRATGDAAKLLRTRIAPGDQWSVTFGTDAGKDGEKQTSDWRSIGLLLGRVENFSIHNLLLRDQHSWAISLEYCAYGSIRDLRFDANNGKVIDGEFQTFLNQDGLDLRQGCHDITVENITGRSGDDLIALTAIPFQNGLAGELDSHMVCDIRPHGRTDDVYNIIIRNVRGYCAGGHHIVRFLNTLGIRMYNIILDGLIDTSPTDGIRDRAAVKIGDSNLAWGGATPLGDTYGFLISNIISRAQTPVLVGGSLCDSQISNIISYAADSEAIACTSGAENMRNVLISNVQTVG